MSEKLDTASDMFFPFKAAIYGAVLVLYKRSTSHTQVGIIRKTLQQKLEIIIIKRDVGIKICNHFKFDTLDFLVTCIETVNFRGKLSVPSIRHPHQLNPWILL